jgi:hypothetical protein
MLTYSQLVDYMRARHQREPWCAIAASLGVSRQAVDGWLTGARRPSRTVLILAAMLARGETGEWPLTGSGDLSGRAG